jgi:transcriptional regulator with XRE-family HTH domain
MTGKELKIKRITLDLTQAQLASELGIQSNTVSRYENGDMRIPKTVELAMELLERRYNERNSDDGAKAA